MLFAFPSFNQWSSPLLFLTLQGLVFAVLFFWRYYQKRTISDLLLGFLLLFLCYHRTTYTIGFMEWYDTFRNTKINYYLVPFGLSTGPLLYLYVKSVTTSGFRLRKADLWHFIPQLLFILYRIILLIYDSMQPGFDATQNGVLMDTFNNQVVEVFYGTFSRLQLVLYLAFTVQLFYHYRQKIHQYYSNTYKMELNWLRNFLAIYLLLFFYDMIETLVGMTILEMHWTHKWWYHFVAALAIIYIGIKGYFTDTSKLLDLEFNAVSPSVTKSDPIESVQQYEREKAVIEKLFLDEKVYLEPDLSLKSLASQLGYAPAQLSEIINTGFGKNFNDFINGYRVEEVKRQLKSGKHKALSLVGIAMDCGFNSKATFNRVFKKISGTSPSEYVKSLPS
ncbi:MAG: AraC family transcriptional regulator [Saprospiraceae bacterium]|nr:AraC family transcriptional regulator [Saprospiraceae bacterium]